MVLDRVRILFINELSEPLTGETPGFKEDFIVIGRKWQPSAEDWLRLNRTGFDKIICSKIEPYRPPPEEYDEISHDCVLPEYIYDLDKTGYLGFTLPLR